MRMRKNAACLMLAAALLAGLCLCARAEAVGDGLYTVGVSSSAKMFRVTGCVLRVEDGGLTAVITLSGQGYGYVYPGTAEEAEAAPRERWIPFVEDADGRYTYAVPIPALDEDVPVAGYSSKYEKWYDRTLRFFSDTLKPYAEVAPEGSYEGTLASDTALDGAACTLVSAADGMTLTLAADGVGALAVDGVPAEAAEDGFRVPLRTLDARVAVVLTADGMETEGWLRLDRRALAAVGRTVADGRYLARAESDSGLLQFTRCELTVSGGKMTAVLTAKKNSFAMVYPGLAKEARSDEGGRVAAVEDAGGAYTYTLEVPALDKPFDLATYSAKKKMWYDRQVVVYGDGMTALP